MTISQLGDTQVRVLWVLSQHPEGEAAPTPLEIGSKLAHRLGWRWWSGVPRDAEHIRASLRRLERHGFVERLGTAATGARCWALTDAGWLAVAELNRAEDTDV